VTPLGWIGIARLGLVQACIGAVVMLGTVVLNRVMVVEMGAAAAIPAGLIAWHYAVQLARPLWGHGSDRAQRRTPWIIGGMVLLAAGALIATQATLMMRNDRALGTFVGAVGFAAIGAGVGCAGTSLLALLAARVGEAQRAGAAAMCWILMIAGIVVAAGITGKLLEPYSEAALWGAVARVCAVAVVLPVIALWGLERRVPSSAAVRQRLPQAGEGKASSAAICHLRPLAAEGQAAPAAKEREGFAAAFRAMWAEPAARRFTGFVFLSMLAYSVQDLIVEPFGGLVFGLTPGQSTSLASVQHGGVLVGMIAAGLGASLLAKRGYARLDLWMVGGCVGAALALLLLAQAVPGWPLRPVLMLLGFSNGVFTVSAIGSMVGLAGSQGQGAAGVRMGVFGAAQAVAFGLGGLIGAVGVQLLRAAVETATAFHAMFATEAALFLGAAVVARTILPGTGTKTLPGTGRWRPAERDAGGVTGGRHTPTGLAAPSHLPVPGRA
jgi:BCD family chlorophyll transporter-like MFS transporter